MEGFYTTYIEDKKDIVYSFSVPVEKCYLDIRRNYNNGTLSFSKIQIVEGSYTEETMPEFEEYKEQTVIFPLLEGQKMYKDSYLADDGIHHKRTQIAVDENTGINKTTNYIQIHDKDKKGAKWGGNTLSNYFKEPGILLGNSGYPWIFIVDTYNRQGYTEFADYTVEEFRQWAIENNLIFEYELQQEKIIEYTEEQQTAYNKLQKLKTYRTVTNISNNQNTNMEITYKNNT